MLRADIAEMRAGRSLMARTITQEVRAINAAFSDPLSAVSGGSGGAMSSAPIGAIGAIGGASVSRDSHQVPNSTGATPTSSELSTAATPRPVAMSAPNEAHLKAAVVAAATADAPPVRVSPPTAHAPTLEELAAAWELPE